ncbi:hypothetical protein [Actinokineospora xionganensis]|uniref:hypothetical protein n=1 Tax=Actinokineospora xionganensis TaxID=2684470 RepID=UPI001FE715C6|nr:hypothetical protein [Actinokineospora xionganensis]
MEINSVSLVLAAIVGLGLLLYALSKRQEKAEPTLPRTLLPKFRVVTLGLQGSGKTLLLTSMYRRLQTPAGGGSTCARPTTSSSSSTAGTSRSPAPPTTGLGAPAAARCGSSSSA